MLVTSPHSGLPRYALSIRPLPGDEAFGLSTPRAVLVVLQGLAARPRPRFEEEMRALFGFSEKEAELATALVTGRSLREAAAERGHRHADGANAAHADFPQDQHHTAEPACGAAAEHLADRLKPLLLVPWDTHISPCSCARSDGQGVLGGCGFFAGFGDGSGW
jgi:hypothetical protein